MAAEPNLFLMNIKRFIAQQNEFCLLLGTIFILAKKKNIYIPGKYIGSGRRCREDKWPGQ